MIRTFRRCLHDDKGLSLVEVLAALTVFAIVTVGIFPLLVSSLRGATLSRSYTVGKNVAVRAMERIRGLPFARSVATTPTVHKIDVLDLFFPCAPASNGVDPACASTGQTPGATGSTGTQYLYNSTIADTLRPGPPQVTLPLGTFVTTCNTTTIPNNAACPRSLPAGYTVRVDTQFVTPTGANPETYAVRNSITSPPGVPTSYNWSLVANESAPSAIVKITVNVSWTVGGRSQLYSLESLVADKRFGIEKISGTARVDYAVRVLTSYNSGGPALTDLTATGVSSTAGITSRLSAIAEEVVSGGQVTLVRQATGSEVAVPMLSPPPTGATSSYAAPPDQTSIPDPSATAPAGLASHPEMCQNAALSVGTGCALKQVGYMAPTHVKGVSVATTSDLPTARGTGLFNPLSIPAYDLYVDAQRNADSITKNPLQLLIDSVYNAAGQLDYPALAIRPDGAPADNTSCVPTAVSVACRSMFATTDATTAALTPAGTRRVETTATTGFAHLRLFPASYIPGAGGASKAVFEINNFTARVNCKATGSTTSPVADATAKWSAQLRYWKETDPNNGRSGSGEGSYQTVALTESNFAAQIQTLKNDPPMIYEEPELGLVKLPQPGDVFMFPKQNLLQGGEYPSYLTDLTGGGAAGSASVSEGGQVAKAAIPGALTFSTSAYIDPDTPQATMNIVLGSLSCAAADRRT